MSRATAVLSPGKANRRFIFLAIALGLLGAILVYMAFSRDSSTSGGSTAGGAEVPVVVAQIDIPARTRITQAMVDVRFVSDSNKSALSYQDPTLVVGKVTRFPISSNEQVLSNKVVTSAPGASGASRALAFTIPAGKRGFAINVSDVATAGGLVLPGDYVDIVIIYDVEFASRAGGEAQVADNFLVQTLYQNIEVLAVQQAVVDTVVEATPSAGSQRVRNSEARPTPGASTVTLALTPEQVQRIYSAESNGKMRLSVRPFGDSEERPIDFFTELELKPQNLPNPFTR